MPGAAKDICGNLKCELCWRKLGPLKGTVEWEPGRVHAACASDPVHALVRRAKALPPVSDEDRKKAQIAKLQQSLTAKAAASPAQSEQPQTPTEASDSGNAVPLPADQDSSSASDSRLQIVELPHSAAAANDSGEEATHSASAAAAAAAAPTAAPTAAAEAAVAQAAAAFSPAFAAAASGQSHKPSSQRRSLGMQIRLACELLRT